MLPGMRGPRVFLASGLLLALAGCGAAPPVQTPGPAAPQEEGEVIEPQRVTEHRGRDDLLSAGLGLAGLQAMVPPPFADPARPTAAELRRRAIWNNWRGIADLSPSGGYGSVYGSVAAVPGREYAALATLPGARQPHRVLVQVPDAFDVRRPCVVVGPASGSRGVYGAIAVAGAWGLPKGCAVAYTDKGAGTDYFDLDAGLGFGLDGRAAGRDGTPAFAPETAAGAGGVAFKHAHSLDHPEADWGRHVRQAAEFALAALDRAHPEAAPFTFAGTRVIAVGISNGGGAVLRAAELEGDWLDAVVAGEPSVDVAGGRSLYDYATEAALLMPCALRHAPLDAPAPALPFDTRPERACGFLREHGLVEGDTPAAQAASAHARLRDAGWTDAALRAGAISVDFDLWRAVAAGYASAYGRYPAGAHPVGYRYVAKGAPSDAARAAWWSDGSGIPPDTGVDLLDPESEGPEGRLGALAQLRGLWLGEDPAGAPLPAAAHQRVRAGIGEVRAGLPRPDLPVMVVHGLDDGLIPPAFTSAPYVAAARAAGRQVGYWEVENVQHFDGFLLLPAYAMRYAPLLPYVYAALDQANARLDGGRAGSVADRRIRARARGAGPVDAAQLAVPAGE